MGAPPDETARLSTVDKRAVPCKPSIVPDWKRFREEARRLAGDGPEEWGWLQVLDNRLMAADEPEPPVTPWWRETLREFWASGCTFFANLKGQRSTASTTITRCLVLETALRSRTVVLGQLAMTPLISANTAEANQRCGPLETVLSKGLSLSKVAERAKLEDPSVYFGSTNETQGRSVFDFADADGHRVRVAIAPATRAAASGFTGAGALVDELDLWPSTGPDAAAGVLTLLHGRLHGQQGARIYHVSTPMGRAGPLSTMIRKSNESGAEGLFVSRLGELGARRDAEARAGFRAWLRERARKAQDGTARAAHARWEADPRLARDPDPRSTIIPTWAARAGDPLAEILECWRLVGVQMSDGDEGGDPLDVLMARYGAEPSDSGGGRLFSPALVEQARALAPAW